MDQSAFVRLATFTALSTFTLDERDDRRRSLGNIHRNISEFVGQVFFAGGFASDSDADARPR